MAATESRDINVRGRKIENWRHVHEDVHLVNRTLLALFERVRARMSLMEARQSELSMVDLYL